MKRVRQKVGSVVFDKRIRTWNFLWCENGRRRSKVIGSIRDYPTKSSAWKAAKAFAHLLEPVAEATPVVTVRTLVEQYRAEKMPKRYSTRRAYEAWLRNHILPKWGDCALTNLQARPVELWLQSLSLAPRSKTGVRMILHLLWDYAQWRGDVPVQRNPMELVTIKNASKRQHQPRSLSVDEFRLFVPHLEEPFHTIALVQVCFGLRISECLALKWSDVDWLHSRLRIQRGIVRQHVDDTKTAYSERPLTIDADMLGVFKRWKQMTQFSEQDDWVFASPVQHGQLPWCADQVNRSYRKACKSAGIEAVSTHCMRHTYRSWLDAVGTPIAVQQKLMRHADIRTTMNIYGDVVTNEMAQAHSKVVGLAMQGVGGETKC